MAAAAVLTAAKFVLLLISFHKFSVRTSLRSDYLFYLCRVCLHFADDTEATVLRLDKNDEDGGGGDGRRDINFSSFALSFAFRHSFVS